MTQSIEEYLDKANQRSKRWAQQHKEKRKEYQRAYYLANKEKLKIYKQEWRRKQREEEGQS